jgi:UDP-N-acetylmuramyl pentapeptide phosphotransferase/UDP-N-acetylglucosamine-1-phosphate transferase
LVAIGASLVVRGEKASMGPYQSPTVRCMGGLHILLGLVVASPLTTDLGTCNRCQTNHALLFVWLAFLAALLASALWRIWGRRGA